MGMSSRVLMPHPYGLGAVARAGLACGQAGTGACQGSAPRGALVFSRDGMRVVVPWARLPRRDPVAVLAGTRVAGCDAVTTPPVGPRAGSTAGRNSASDLLTDGRPGMPTLAGRIGVLAGQASATRTAAAANTPATGQLTAARWCVGDARRAVREGVRMRRMAQSGRI